ncbi:stage III sporulation protein AH [Sporolactobacillus sp. THM7-7]|nr:stage III sporulation protein AH [Sporolactobacillus sp. THM7-7]
MLKKQTVWLLTMLSLIVVLSVYALTSPDESKNQTAGDGSKAAKEVTADGSQESTKSSAAEDKLASIEIEKVDERAELDKQYQSVIASEDSSTKDISAAYDKMEAMKELANNEKMLEDVIRSKGFGEAVVRTDAAGREVEIFVDSNKLTDQRANEMIQMANKYLGTGKVVSVRYAIGEK